MQVILLNRVQNLGDLGEIVNVKNGYARNYLIPQKLASRATEDNIKAFEAQKAELVAKANESRAAAEARAESINGLSITITANASPEGHLYGSVGPREISEKLTESGYPVDASEVIQSEGAFKDVGEYEVKLILHADVEADFTLTVEAEEEEA
ncbi:50S ribosomal protein L9 [Marinicella sp. S1101]|uniref:50S ribosomal protein L9 n=1 Tax=Marinicella marina TaxID=2996016 RepID=UPI002260E18D|nr:50S ribosomal protein L9 [Marinicella marina]MCX7553413.1 50S ribosomal protein L9 [Marinicella marina]MDJ1140037.1 50S ribosomal protein L9 [Marinicella marina]